MYVQSKAIIEKALKEHYAVPAFNAENLEMIQAIISAAEQMNSPVIIQTTPPTVKYLDADEAYAMVSVLAGKTNIPVALHLDHCTDFENVMKGKTQTL